MLYPSNLYVTGTAWQRLPCQLIRAAVNSSHSAIPSAETIDLLVELIGYFHSFAPYMAA